MTTAAATVFRIWLLTSDGYLFRQVHATDEDKGVNGQVKYSIVQQPNQKGTKFTVDEETGEVSTNKVRDACSVNLPRANLCLPIFFGNSAF